MLSSGCFELQIDDRNILYFSNESRIPERKHLIHLRDLSCTQNDVKTQKKKKKTDY